MTKKIDRNAGRRENHAEDQATIFLGDVYPSLIRLNKLFSFYSFSLIGKMNVEEIAHASPLFRVRAEFERRDGRASYTASFGKCYFGLDFDLAYWVNGVVEPLYSHGITLRGDLRPISTEVKWAADLMIHPQLSEYFCPLTGKPRREDGEEKED